MVDINSPSTSNGGGTVAPNALFYVDNLRIDNVTINTQYYDDRGRITNNKTGFYNYDTSAKPYQNTSIVGAINDPVTTSTYLIQSVTYNAFKAPIQIAGINTSTKISFGYNANEQRSVMYYGSNATDKLARTKRRYYSADGSMEISATFPTTSNTTPTSVEFLTYIGGTAYSAPLVLKSDGTSYNYFYLHRDYQSTILAITNATGGVVEKRLFDPWGLLTKVQDGAGVTLAKMMFFDRGYTGHEHLQDVGLINMNARLYNPNLHRFLEADNFIQDPYNTQNYNRYGYCVNNPLKYTDVTGNVFNIATFTSCIPVVGSIFSSLLMHQPVDWGRVGVDILVTGISIAVTAGIGTACATIGNFYTRAAVSALAHGVFQGGLSAATGGKFWAGFAAGAVSSIASSFWQGGTDNIKNPVTGNMESVAGTGMVGIGAGTGAVGTIAFASIMGGAASALAGGNFWQGAVTGMIVSGFNHVMHKIQQNGDLKQWLKKAGVNYSDIPNMSSEQVLDLISKVPELGQFYNESGNFDIGVNKDVDYDLTSGTRGSRCGTMTFGTDAFKSMLNLGRSIIHETGHALDIYSGKIYRFDSIKDKDFRRDVIENRMYERELQYALPEYNRSGLQYRNEFYKRISNRGYDPDSFLKW